MTDYTTLAREFLKPILSMDCEPTVEGIAAFAREIAEPLEADLAVKEAEREGTSTACANLRAKVAELEARLAEAEKVREAIPMSFLSGRSTIEAVREMTAAGRRLGERAEAAESRAADAEWMEADRDNWRIEAQRHEARAAALEKERASERQGRLEAIGDRDKSYNQSAALAEQVRGLESALAEARKDAEETKELLHRVAAGKEPSRLLDRAEASEARERQMREALGTVVNALGPHPCEDTRCSGCAAEWSSAYEAAKSALSPSPASVEKPKEGA